MILIELITLTVMGSMCAAIFFTKTGKQRTRHWSKFYQKFVKTANFLLTTLKVTSIWIDFKFGFHQNLGQKEKKKKKTEKVRDISL